MASKKLEMEKNEGNTPEREREKSIDLPLPPPFSLSLFLSQLPASLFPAARRAAATDPALGEPFNVCVRAGECKPNCGITQLEPRTQLLLLLPGSDAGRKTARRKMPAS